MRNLALLALAALFATAARADDLDVKELWKEKNCAKCHGNDGMGQTPMGKKNHSPNFTRARWQQRHDDAEIKKAIIEGVVEDGKRKMPAFGSKLSPEQIDALVGHVRSFGGAKAGAPAATPKVESENKSDAETKTKTETETTSAPTDPKPDAKVE